MLASDCAAVRYMREIVLHGCRHFGILGGILWNIPGIRRACSTDNMLFPHLDKVDLHVQALAVENKLWLG